MEEIKEVIKEAVASAVSDLNAPTWDWIGEND